MLGLGFWETLNLNPKTRSLRPRTQTPKPQGLGFGGLDSGFRVKGLRFRFRIKGPGGPFTT